MSKINILILGSGLYFCGRGANNDGTILPSIMSDDLSEKINSCTIFGFSEKGLKSSKNKIFTILKKHPNNKIKFFFQKISLINKMLRKNYFDCGIVSLPDHMHYSYIDLLLKNNVHVMTVKPFVLSLAEGLYLADIAKKKNIINTVDFHKRFDIANLYIKKTIFKKKLGNLLYSTVEYSQPINIPTEKFKKWSKYTNIFNYLGVHYVDMIYFLTGFEPVSVYASGSKDILKKKYGIDTYDYIQAIINWRKNDGSFFSSSINVNWIDPLKSNSVSDQRINFFGDEGKIKSDQTYRGISLHLNNEFINPNPYFSEEFYNADGQSYHDGYGIKSFKLFLKEVFYKKNKIVYKKNEDQANFKTSLISVAVSEAVNQSLASGNIEFVNKQKTTISVLVSKKKKNKGEKIYLKDFNSALSTNQGISVKNFKRKSFLLKNDIKINQMLDYSHIYDL
jgi:predicted dehydrogenase